MSNSASEGSTKQEENAPPVRGPTPHVGKALSGEEDLRDERLSSLQPAPLPAKPVEVTPEPAEPGPDEVTAVQAEDWPPPRALWIETGVMLLVTTVPHVFYSIWFHWLPYPQTLPFAYIECAYILESAALGALGLYFIWRSGEPMEEFGIVKPSCLDIPGGILIMGVVWSTFGLLFDPFLERFLSDASYYNDRVSPFFPKPQSLTEYGLLALACAAIGLQEEIIYRGYLLPRLGKLTGSDGAGLLVGALIFALVHWGAVSGDPARMAPGARSRFNEFRGYRLVSWFPGVLEQRFPRRAYVVIRGDAIELQPILLDGPLILYPEPSDFEAPSASPQEGPSGTARP